MSLDISSLIEKAEIKPSETGGWKNKSIEFVYENTQILVYLGLHNSLPDTNEYPVYKIWKTVGEKKEVIFDTRKLIKGKWANILETDGKVIITISIKHGTYVKIEEKVSLDDMIQGSYFSKKTSPKSGADTKPEISSDTESVKDFIARLLPGLNVSEIDIGEILIDKEGVRIQNLHIFFDK